MKVYWIKSRGSIYNAWAATRTPRVTLNSGKLITIDWSCWQLLEDDVKLHPSSSASLTNSQPVYCFSISFHAAGASITFYLPYKITILTYIPPYIQFLSQTLGQRTNEKKLWVEFSSWHYSPFQGHLGWIPFAGIGFVLLKRWKTGTTKQWLVFKLMNIEEKFSPKKSTR